MSKKTNKQAGFTLVEISMAMAIFTFMLLVVSMAYINIARLYNASTAARNVQQNNRFAMEQISRVARSSVSADEVPDSAMVQQGVCFKSSSGEQLFYLHSLSAAQDTEFELRQSSSCNNPTDGNSKVLTSSGVYVAKLEAKRIQNTITISMWMSARVDLLDTNDPSGLKCKTGAGTEFCAINKLTTTVELRGN